MCRTIPERLLLTSASHPPWLHTVRAIGLYAAEEASQGAKAEAAVKAVFDALNDFDGALLQASRSSSAVDSDALRGKAGAAIEAFDGLLELVPAAAKRQAEEVLERIR